MSQSAQLLELLRDGQWWTTHDLLRVVPSIIHSRISDLRKAGHVIEHRTTGVGAVGSEYRLLNETGPGEAFSPESPSLASGGPVSLSSTGGAAPAGETFLGDEEQTPFVGVLPAVSPDQLSIEEAA